MKKNKIIYWVATGFMTLIFLFSAGMYLFANDMASAAFQNLGFPTWLIYPLAILKILGLIAVLSKKSKFLKELAYSGFMFDTVLAASAHILANDGEFLPAVLALIATFVSWIYDRKVFNS